MRYSRIDLSVLNAFLALSPFSKINKSRFSKKLSKKITKLNLPADIDADSIVSEYIDHLNGDLFSPLGRRLHSILSHQSLSEGVRFLQKSNNIKVDTHPPIIVVGLPRSGTTNLHNFIINNFNFSGLRYWQLSSPSKVSRNPFIDKKIRRFKSMVGFYLYRYLIPSIQSMHRVNMDTYEECWHFQRHLFLCYNYVIQIKFLQLEDYLKTIDTTPLLNHYKTFIMESNKNKQTALKCPDHMMFLPDLLNTFPKAKIIWVHRNPFDSISSYCPMIESVWNLFFGGTNKKEVGSFISELYERMLKKTMLDRENIKQEIIDVSFNQLIDDRQALLNHLSDKLEMPVNSSREQNRASSFFKNKYSFDPSEYSISREDIEDKFSFYTKEYSKYL